MSAPTITPPAKWRDPEGNVYGVEKAVKNNRFVVIRTNPGGNRKGAKQFCVVSGNAAFMQKTLNEYGKENGWKEVSQ